MQVRISKKECIAEQTYEVTLETEKPIIFTAGQYFYLTLLDPPFEDSKGNRRDFSIVNPPHENTVIRFCTRLSDSAFKRSLLELPLGTNAEGGSITGDFMLTNKPSQHIIGIAGGIGISPFVSILSDLKHARSKQKLTLFYSNRTSQTAVYTDKLKEFTQTLTNFTLIPIMTRDPNWTGENTYITKSLLELYHALHQHSTYFVAGKPDMVDSVYHALLGAQVEPKNIMTEQFAGY